MDISTKRAEGKEYGRDGTEACVRQLQDEQKIQERLNHVQIEDLSAALWASKWLSFSEMKLKK